MTGVSAYKVYRTICCHDVFDEPLYASSNSTTIFDYITVIECVCKKKYHLDDLEFVGYRRNIYGDLRTDCDDYFKFPAWLRKGK
jgi:hypothetical protein